MPVIKKFNGDQSKLKGFLTQIKIRINNKGPKLVTPFDKVIYAGMHLIEKPLKWFQSYLSEAQTNGITTTNKEVRYMFLSWENFKTQLVQIYRDSKEEETVTKKLYKLKQTGSAMMYTTEFQVLSVQVDWSKKGLMSQYKKGLKSKVLDALVLIEDPENMWELIDKVIKIDNRIYQREWANRGNIRQILMKKAPQQAVKQ